MSLFKPITLDMARCASELASWIERRDPRLVDVTVEGLRANQGAGFSNETLLATARHRGGVLDLVIRFGPRQPDDGLFADYDIPKQFHVMRALSRTAVPAPHCRWLETDTTLFGSPFFVMDRVDGQIPADQPHYYDAGFVKEASEAKRARLWWSTVESLAKVGKVDVAAAGLDFLRWPDRTKAPVEQHLDHLERCFRWGRGKSPDFPQAELALKWLRRHLPRDEPLGLLWGDARLGNVIFRDFRPAALLDWEMAGIGNPEADLAYFLGFESTGEVEFAADVPPRLPGFGAKGETIARFEELIGRPTRHVAYYWAFNTFKYLAIMQRFYDLKHRAGWISAEEAEAQKMAGPGIVDRLMAAAQG